MIFRDRNDAGKRLAKELREFEKDPKAIVIALPRGGVVVGYEVAQALHLPLDIVCPRKIGAPFNPEYAIGAITETGEGIFSKELLKEFGITEEHLQQLIAQEKEVAKKRLDSYRRGRPPRNLKGKHVIIVDDGLATGSTMRAAIQTVRGEEAKQIIMAIPVAPPDTLAHLSKEVTRAFCLSTSSSFYAVGQFYDLFDQTTDEEVIRLLSLSSSALHE